MITHENVLPAVTAGRYVAAESSYVPYTNFGAKAHANPLPVFLVGAVAAVQQFCDDAEVELALVDCAVIDSNLVIDFDASANQKWSIRNLLAGFDFDVDLAHLPVPKSKSVRLI